MNKNKVLKVLGIAFVAVVLIIYVKFFTSNTDFDKEEVYVQIPTGSTYADVEKIISPYIKNMSSFGFIANRRSYPDNISICYAKKYSCETCI
jgi:UPF0755 protein